MKEKELHMEDSVPYPKQFVITSALRVKIFPFHKAEPVFTLGVLALKTLVKMDD